MDLCKTVEPHFLAMQITKDLFFTGFGGLVVVAGLYKVNVTIYPTQDDSLPHTVLFSNLYL